MAVISPMADAHSAPDEEARMNVDAAAHFLSGQASWLCRALMGPGDPSAVGLVLGAHDRSHESWLTLIASAARVDDDAAQAALGRRCTSCPREDAAPACPRTARTTLPQAVPK